MNAPETVPAGNRLLPKLVILLALVFLLMFCLLGFGLTGYFRLGRDVKALRNGLLDAAAAEYERRIEINVGAFTLNIVRAGLGFIDLDSNARAALRAVRSGEVGVYRLHRGHTPPDRSAMLSAADKAMAHRGWDRLLGVINRHELVAVYVSGERQHAQDMTVCLVVLNGRELIVGSARSNLEPLMTLALNTHLSRDRAPLSKIMLSTSTGIPAAR